MVTLPSRLPFAATLLREHFVMVTLPSCLPFAATMMYDHFVFWATGPLAMPTPIAQPFMHSQITYISMLSIVDSIVVNVMSTIP